MAMIANIGINELRDALIHDEIPPTRSEISNAMELAYEAGKIDGALEAFDKAQKIFMAPAGAQPKGDAT